MGRRRHLGFSSRLKIQRGSVVGAGNASPLRFPGICYNSSPAETVTSALGSLYFSLPHIVFILRFLVLPVDRRFGVSFDLFWCHFTAKGLKGVRLALFVTNPILNLSPCGVAYGTLIFDPSLRGILSPPQTPPWHIACESHKKISGTNAMITSGDNFQRRDEFWKLSHTK